MLEVHVAKRLAAFDLDIAFNLDAEVLALFGPSGAGKSMTLKMMAGIETPDSGSIRSQDRLLYHSASGVNVPPQRRNVGYVPQQYALFPHLSAHENIAFPLRKGQGWNRTRADARAMELLELFGLASQRDTHPRALSGGQQQRVAIARAVAGNPAMLLLDEPFAALDAPTRAELRNEFRLLQQRLAIPALFVTHDLEEAATLAGRIAVVVDGRIRQIDQTRSILDRPADRQVAELVQSRNIIPGTVQEDRGTIQTAAGLFSTGNHTFARGTAVDVVIRPDSIRIVDTATEYDQLLSGTVTDLVDFGTRIAVLVDVNGIPFETTLTPSAARRQALAIDQPAQLAICPDDIHVIERRAEKAQVGADLRAGPSA